MLAFARGDDGAIYEYYIGPSFRVIRHAAPQPPAGALRGFVIAMVL